jgi:hypothetical protein
MMPSHAAGPDPHLLLVVCGWTKASKPPFDDTDLCLFGACTNVIVGNGRTTRFWQCAWVNGQAPRDLAPSLYKLAWRKHNSVEEDLRNMNWTRGLWRMQSVEQMAEFVAFVGCSAKCTTYTTSG